MLAPGSQALTDTRDFLHKEKREGWACQGGTPGLGRLRLLNANFSGACDPEVSPGLSPIVQGHRGCALGQLCGRWQLCLAPDKNMGTVDFVGRVSKAFPGCVRVYMYAQEKGGQAVLKHLNLVTYSQPSQ